MSTAPGGFERHLVVIFSAVNSPSIILLSLPSLQTNEVEESAQQHRELQTLAGAAARPVQTFFVPLPEESMFKDSKFGTYVSYTV
jgi:hypothetical protein